MKSLSYDVVVVGAGPAGSSAAKAAARGHASVLLIDRKNSVGLPVQCAEFVPRLLLREVEVDRSCIAQEVEIMRTHLPGGQSYELRSPGYILHRALFDRALAISAINEGAHFLNRTRVTALSREGAQPPGRGSGPGDDSGEGEAPAEPPRRFGGSLTLPDRYLVTRHLRTSPPSNGSGAGRSSGGGAGRSSPTNFWTGVVAQQGTEQIRVEARVIIGADGPHSTIGSCLGQVNTRFVQAMQYEVALEHESNATEVYFDRAYPAGYGWLFPKGQTANVGVGLVAGRPVEGAPRASLRETLDRFLDRLIALRKVKGDGMVSTTSGQIPVGGYLETVVGNALLVGDAAGHSHPITGAGIAAAVLCGQIAGEVAARAVQSGDLGVLGDYERRWKGLFSEVLDHALARRRLMEREWATAYIEELVRRCWVGFKEYAR